MNRSDVRFMSWRPTLRDCCPLRALYTTPLAPTNVTDNGAATKDFQFHIRPTSPLLCIGLFVGVLVEGVGVD
ncbi:MAG: hypothetical protein ACKO3V_04035 [Pirellula sp.]